MLTTNRKFAEVFDLKQLVGYNAEKVTFEAVWGNENGGVTLLGLTSGQTLPQHTAPAEVMVCVLEGHVKFTMLDRELDIQAGQFALMGAGVPHSVEAVADSKIMLVKLKP